MSWYIHPSRHLDGDELPPELVVTSGDGSITQVYVPCDANDANDVLRDIDQLRRDLSGYHGQLKAHNDLQRHCDNQRKRISELEGLYARAKAENAELRGLVQALAFCATDRADCGKCQFDGSFYNGVGDGLCDEVLAYMSELGIEMIA